MRGRERESVLTHEKEKHTKKARKTAIDKRESTSMSRRTSA